MALSVEIMTPERLVLQADADSVTLPAFDGELGVLAGHAPLLAQLTSGEVRLRRNESVETFAVSGGFAEVRDDKVSIFAETAEMAQEIDAERAKQAAERARAAIKAASGSREDMFKAEAALLRALARLRAAESVRRKSSHSTHR